MGNDAELAPLMAAERELAPLRTANVSTDFVVALEQRMQARIATRQVEHTTATQVDAPAPRAIVSLGRPRRRTTSRRVIPYWQAIAAAIALMFIGVGALTVAAHASPGQTLYGLRLWEQDVRVSLTADPVDRARMHLSYAQDALGAVRDAAHQHNMDAYTAALNSLESEEDAAATSIAGLPASSDRIALVTQLDALRTSEHSTLRAALPKLNWQERVATTGMLGTLGDPVPQIASAVILWQGDGEHDTPWKVIVYGSGFQHGSHLNIDGHAEGQVLSVTDSTLTALLSHEHAISLPGQVGVENPDGTAASTSTIMSVRNAPGGSSSATATPDERHSGDTSGQPGNSGTEHDPTKERTPTPPVITPTATRTPEPNS